MDKGEGSSDGEICVIHWRWAQEAKGGLCSATELGMRLRDLFVRAEERFRINLLLPCPVASGSHVVPAGALTWDNTVSRQREIRTVGSMWSTGLE